MRNTLLTEIEAFLAESGLSASRFGWLATRNARLVERLREGKPVLTTTETRVREWLIANRDRKSRRAA
jgi:lysine/ornithine N-monooxygenase